MAQGDLKAGRKSSQRGIRSFAKGAVGQLALLGASAIALQGAAWAETNDVSGVTVTGEHTAQVIDAPKYTAPILDTPQTITVVNSQIIEEQSLLGLRDILSTLPGITFGAGEGGGGYGDSINLRGYSANNDITVDGVRDSAQYSRTDPFNLEQVELTSGANSVYSGVGSVGGTINLVTKRPLMRDFTDASIAAGTEEYGRVTLDLNRQMSDNAAFRLNFMAHQNDVPGRDVDRYERWGVAPALTFGLGANTSATLLLSHQEDDNTPQYGVPYALGPYNDGALPGVDDSDYFGYQNIDTQETERSAATLIVEHAFNDVVSVRNLTRVQTVSQYLIVNPPQGTWCVEPGINPWTGVSCASPGTYLPSGPRGTLRDTTNDIFVNQTDFRFNFATGGLQHTLAAGVSFTEETYRLDNGNVLRNPLGATPNPTLPTMDIGNPDNIWTGPVNFIRASYTDTDLSNQAVYLFDRIEIGDHWELNGGVRVEHNETEAYTTTITTPYPPPPALPIETVGPAAETDETLISYRIGLVYKPTEDSSIYFAYGNSETPSQSTVNGACTVTSTTGTANCNVDPEEAVSYELGAKWALDNRLLLTAAIFRNERTNFRVNSGDITIPEQQLDGSQRVDGLALGAAGLISDNWSVFANYTFLDSEILQNISDIAIGGGAIDFQAGDPLPNTPKHSFSLWTTYEFPFGLTLGYGATYQGELTFNRQSATTPLFYTDAYWVHRAMAAYELTDNVIVQLNVNNLFDEEYYTRIRNNATNGWATPGDARAAVLSLNFAF
ncbi:MAG: TonB-dependent receptor [Hyphomonadaceae bacterium]